MINGRIVFLLLLLCAFSSAYSQGEVSKSKKYYIISLCDEKIDIVKKYISAIANKEYDRRIRSRKVRSVLAHFKGNASIEVSNSNYSDISTQFASDYFRRLRDLNFSQVEISWEKDTKGISEVEFVDENKYFVTGRYIQRFRGYNKEGEVAYSDVTVKRLSIEIEEKIDLEGVKYIDVLISGIGIEATYNEKEFDQLFNF